MDISQLVQLCKTSPKGEVGVNAVRERTKIAIENPKADPMTDRLLPILERVDFSKFNSVLDAGCYGGFLYHHKKPKGYVGIDIWEEAIEAAKSLAPDVDFRHENLMNHDGFYDLVWSTQIIQRYSDTPMDEIFKKLKSLGRYHVIAFSEKEDWALPNSSYKEGTLHVWMNLP